MDGGERDDARPIDEWFNRYIAWHCQTYPHSMYPKAVLNPKSEDDRARNSEAENFFAVWRKAFEKMNVSRAEARDATEHLATIGSIFPVEQLSLMLARIRARRKESSLEVEKAKFERVLDQDAKRKDALARVRAEWEMIPEEERDAFRREIRAENTFLESLGKSAARWVELLSFQAFAEGREEVVE